MSKDDDRREMNNRLAAGKLDVEVGSCQECPFFRVSLGAILADAVGGAVTFQRGDCVAPVPRLSRLGGGVLLNSPLPVEDKRVIPKWCPLRNGPVVVSVTAGN